MRYRENADLDTSNVRDLRGGGGGGIGGRGVALGGGGLGLVGLVIFVLLQFAGGGGGGTGSTVSDALGQLGQLGAGQTADNTQLEQHCQKGKDANQSVDCAVVADIESIDEFWSQQLGTRYKPTDTVFFSGSVQTGCGAADTGSGPFYCPPDQLVYIDLSFFQDLQRRFGAEGGLFVDAYVIAHEYGHHVQNLLGTNQQVTPGETGPTSGSVRLELQADCYAGAWANHATTVPDNGGAPLIEQISQDDINRALDAASRIGDDFIQRNLGGGTVNQNAFTHGSSAQREKWFSTGYRSGDPAQCDTFGTDNLG
jgi:predicted metalloprotease